MAKIKVAGVSYDQSNYTIMVTLVESRVIEGDDVDVPLGEASVRFPSGMPMDDIKKLVVKTAEQISKAHHNSVDKGKDISELDFPDIP